jgi:uncharacterized Zn-binding protein involved in type VI secretion
MGNAAVIGTTSDHGGSMITATGADFTTPGGPVSVIGDLHSCPLFYGPGAPHGVTPIVSGCAVHATVGGKAVAMAGSVAGCGATLVGSFAADTVVA